MDVAGGIAGGGISEYPLESDLLVVLGDSDLVEEPGPPDDDGRDVERSGEEGRGADGGRDATCLGGDPVADLGDSEARCWFPGSASGELVVGVK